MEHTMKCPLKFLKKETMSEDFECEQDKCAWWCSWAKCCAIAAIPVEISDRAHDVINTIRN